MTSIDQELRLVDYAESVLEPPSTNSRLVLSSRGNYGRGLYQEFGHLIHVVVVGYRKVRWLELSYYYRLEMNLNDRNNVRSNGTYLVMNFGLV